MIFKYRNVVLQCADLASNEYQHRYDNLFSHYLRVFHAISQRPKSYVVPKRQDKLLWNLIESRHNVTPTRVSRSSKNLRPALASGVIIVLSSYFKTWWNAPIQHSPPFCGLMHRGSDFHCRLLKGKPSSLTFLHTHYPALCHCNFFS